MKKKTMYECIECGYQSAKYLGKCPQCNTWNSMVESKSTAGDAGAGDEDSKIKAIKLSEIDNLEIQRVITGMKEFDRVLGGGIVPDSIVLIGGEPGVGKSTLLMEVSGLLAKTGKKVLYYSGEESAVQIKMRASRLGVDSDNILLLNMGTLEDLKHSIEEHQPSFLIVDSIQTINSRKGPMLSGSVGAMRYITAELVELAKSNHIAAFIVGHITKEGQIAGPKTLEHMVDAVLYFQGELKSDLRILRAEKNRFGPVDELGIFEMTKDGLTPINDPSVIFLQHRKSTEPGISLYPTMSGLRALLIEIQSLVSESPFAGNPRRISVGFDGYRMSMLISVIEKKLKLPFYKSDVFLNIAGGMLVKETAGDLAAAAALISSYKNIALPKDIIIIGELGLTGEVRPVSFIDNRVKEGIRQGFCKFVVPAAQANIRDSVQSMRVAPPKENGETATPHKPSAPPISIHPVENLYEFYKTIMAPIK